MLNKKQKLLVYGALIGSLTGAVLLGWLTLPTSRDINGIPKQIKYQAPAGEQIVVTDQAFAPSSDTEFEYEGHRYRLDIKIDQPNISPLAGSFITGKIQLLKDGSPTSEVPQFMISRRSEAGINKDIPAVIVDMKILNQQMQVVANTNSPRIMIDDTPLDLGGHNMVSWNRLTKGIGSTKDDGKPNPFSPYLYTPWDAVFSSPQALDYGGVIDLSGGQATFKYQHNGIRVSSYLELSMSLGEIKSSKRVNFQDDDKVTVPQPTNKPKTSDIYYEVITSKAVTNKPQNLSIEVVSHNRNGSINTSPLQRVRLAVMPIAISFLPQNTTSRSGITGTIKIDTAGKFIETDESKYKYGTNLERWGERRTTNVNGERSDDLSAIYIDLVDGKATIDFEYRGKTGPLPYLAIVVQPADFFVNYTAWNTNPPAKPDFKIHTWDNLIKECESNNTCSPSDAGERAYVNNPPYHRETAEITYPPYPNQTDNSNPYSSMADFNIYNLSNPSTNQYFLYLDEWHTREEFTDFVIHTTAFKLLPISSANSSIQWAWWWFMSLSIVQLLTWSIKILILKRKQKYGNA